jgi:hypothetical protein
MINVIDAALYERKTPMSSTRSTPLLYSAALESPEAHESEVEAEIAATLHKISETTLKPGAPLRSVHAKSHGLLYGRLTVPAGLPDELAQGLFATAGIYPVMMRFSTVPGDILDDSISTPRGMAVKVVGVAGDRVAGSEGDATQDFVLVNGPAFSAPDAAGFLKSLKLLEPTTNKLEHVKKLTSAVARGAEAVLEAAGTKSVALTSLGGQPEHHILGEIFYSQTPILYGKYIAKIGVFPISPELTALTKLPLTNNGEPNMLRNVVVDFCLQNSATWEVRVQLCTNPETMPIEDASAVWPEDESPYVTVATITAAAQDPWTVEKITAIDQGLAFSPWHALAAHRPLGSVNRARKMAYEMSARFRAEHQGREIREPRSMDDLAN